MKNVETLIIDPQSPADHIFNKRMAIIKGYLINPVQKKLQGNYYVRNPTEPVITIMLKGED
jgi:hypothetical protein